MVFKSSHFSPKSKAPFSLKLAVSRSASFSPKIQAVGYPFSLGREILKMPFWAKTLGNFLAIGFAFFGKIGQLRNPYF